MVVALEHPAERPELDWWFGRTDPPGNRVLAGIVQGLCDWIPGELGFRAVHLPYHVERGGAYLKDAAVLAGLGCIGLNNLLVTPEYGPRVRLRALTLDVGLRPTGPSVFDPCAGCEAPCRNACPQGAFARPPARTGSFSRPLCQVQMEFDVNAATGDDTAVPVIKYCRACELSCRVGA
jgi:epoxyqueuosine reductase